MFVARVVGESMNRRIPNGAWCLFRVAGAGTRQGKVVLAQHREIEDAETPTKGPAGHGRPLRRRDVREPEGEDGRHEDEGTGSPPPIGVGGRLARG
jgi:hypothetical protein